ncbi:MAG TPA: hypothetical protein VFA11_01750 [Acidimicrobiales bacterium]|nr:hypothetical protein [Acidimicrobiales bacterium]
MGWEGLEFDFDGPVGEAEALLAGRFCEHAVARGWAIPSWAWLNRVAHADPGELERLAANGPRRLPAGQAAPDWRAALAAIARDVLDAADGEPEVLSLLQRRALVPLELALMAAEERGSAGVTPVMLARLSQAAMRGHPSMGWPAF